MLLNLNSAIMPYFQSILLICYIFRKDYNVLHNKYKRRGNMNKIKSVIVKINLI